MISIYKILSPDFQECYVGSTKQTLKRRMQVHKRCIDQCRSRILFEKYGYENCSAIIVEQCEQDKRKEKEQWWLEHSVGTVNRNNPIAICYDAEYHKQWNNTHKQQCLNKDKRYRELHKEELKQKRKKRYALTKT
jgi:hypothetical protein